MDVKKHICILVFLQILFVVNAHAQLGGIAPSFDYKRVINNFVTDTFTIHEYIRKGNIIRVDYNDSTIAFKKKYLADSIKWYYWRAIILSSQIGYKFGLAKAYANIAGLYSGMGDYKQSLYYYKQSEKYSDSWVGEEEKRSEFINILYNNFASTYFHMGDYARAVEYYYKLLTNPRINTEIDRALLSTTYAGLANIWNRMGRKEQAMQYYNFSENLANACNDTVSLVSILSNKSALAIDLGQLQKAIYYATKSIQFGIAIKNYPHDNIGSWKKSFVSSSIASAYSNLALAYMKLGDPIRALYYANKGIDGANRSAEDLLSTYYILGYLHYRLGNYKKAKEYLLPALEDAYKKGTNDNLQNAYSILASTYYAEGDYKTAYAYKNAYAILMDSIQGIKNSKVINDLEVKNKLIVKERELVQNRLELITQSNQLRDKNLLIGGICALALFAGTFGFYRYRNKQQMQEKKIGLLQQEQEIRQLKAMMEGEEKERMRIARDLHDGVSQTISAVKVNMMVMENEIIFADDNKKAKFKKIIDLIDSSFREVRTISHNMMPYALREAGLALLIKQLIDNIASAALTVNLFCNGLDEHFDSNIETVIYRVIQECINNVLKHSQATRLDISLTKDEDGLSITIEDNGVGFDTQDIDIINGIGMKNIRARIHYLHGQVEYDSSLGNGTLVSIQIPVSNTTEKTS